jgi:hypothetical protein
VYVQKWGVVHQRCTNTLIAEKRVFSPIIGNLKIFDITEKNVVLWFWVHNQTNKHFNLGVNLQVGRSIGREDITENNGNMKPVILDRKCGIKRSLIWSVSPTKDRTPLVYNPESDSFWLAKQEPNSEVFSESIKLMERLITTKETNDNLKMQLFVSKTTRLLCRKKGCLTSLDEFLVSKPFKMSFESNFV